MANDLHNLSKALEVLEQSAIRTSQGTFVKVEDLKKLVDDRNEDLTTEELDRIIGPRTFLQAKARIQKYPDIMDKYDDKGQLIGEVQQQRSVSGDL